MVLAENQLENLLETHSSKQVAMIIMIAYRRWCCASDVAPAAAVLFARARAGSRFGNQIGGFGAAARAATANPTFPIGGTGCLRKFA